MFPPDCCSVFHPSDVAGVCRYLNASGLMWESAEEFGALLVFAEHRRAAGHPSACYLTNSLLKALAIRWSLSLLVPQVLW
jgi:hypothetical protein